MESFFFCINSPTYLNVISWNINGITNKLENDDMLKWLINYDVIFLNEIKTDVMFNLPGYKTYLSCNSNRRGGTALLLKNYLINCVGNIDTTLDGQIWLELSILQNITLVGCYIPPSDSPYFDGRIFANM